MFKIMKANCFMTKQNSLKVYIPANSWIFKRNWGNHINKCCYCVETCVGSLRPKEAHICVGKDMKNLASNIQSLGLHVNSLHLCKQIRLFQDWKKLINNGNSFPHSVDISIYQTIKHYMLHEICF